MASPRVRFFAHALRICFETAGKHLRKPAAVVWSPHALRECCVCVIELEAIGEVNDAGAGKSR